MESNPYVVKYDNSQNPAIGPKLQGFGAIPPTAGATSSSGGLANTFARPNTDLNYSLTGGTNPKDFATVNYDGSSLTQGALPNAVPNDEGGLFGLSNKTWGTGLAAANTVLGLASYLDNVRKSDEEIKASKEKRDIMKKDFAATEAYRKSYA